MSRISAGRARKGIGAVFVVARKVFEEETVDMEDSMLTSW
jgi:hypothetical protein